MSFNGRAATAKIEENAERVRRLVPPEHRADHALVVYAVAGFMYEHSGLMNDEQVILVFEALAWASGQ
jgi:hypothetical protein